MIKVVAPEIGKLAVSVDQPIARSLAESDLSDGKRKVSMAKMPP